MPRRHPHYLKSNSSKDYPQQCIWFDTETAQRLTDGSIIELADWKSLRVDADNPKRDNLEVRHELTVGYAKYLRKHHDGKWSDEAKLRFTTLDQFWKFVLSKVRKKTRLYLFCHNTAFDLPVCDVFGLLPRYGYTLRKAIIDAPPTVLQFSNGAESIVIIDTLNIWRVPLWKLGQSIGLPKLDMPSASASPEEWDTYGFRDVEIICLALIKWWEFLQLNDMGGFGPTVASQAMLVFRHKYMKHRIFIDTNERALALTREGYHGGRVECFRIGTFQGQFYGLDVNSMYPKVMRDNSFPCKLIAHTRYATLHDIRIWLRSYAVVARVLLRTNKPFVPVHRDGKLIFATGEFPCILSTPELQYALVHAEVLEVMEVAVYEQAPLFTEYMDAVQTGKRACMESGDTVGQDSWKHLGTNFYGKWGQNGTQWQESSWIDDLSCDSWGELDLETGEIIHHRQLGGLVQVRLNDGESRDSFPAIAGHVTAYARMKLWALIEQAGTGNVYYCDTDCVWVNEEGKHRLASELDEYELGALKVENAAQQITLYGPKDYKFGGKEKTKGVRKEAIWISPNRIQQEQWSGMKGLIAKGDVTAPRTRKIIKTLKRVYDKGQIQPDGVVTPHRLMLPPPGQTNPHE